MAFPATDDGVREQSGVVASLRATPDGRLFVVLDDVRQQPAVDALSWTHERFFTTSGYPRQELENLGLTQEQFAKLGENIVIRLLALAKDGGASGGYGAV